MQYYGADSSAPMVVMTCVGFGVMIFTVLLLRLFSQIHVVNAIGADDILIVIACLLSWAFMVTSILGTRHGLGSHLVNVPSTDHSPYFQAVWLSLIFYNTCLGFIKTSVLSLYIRRGDRGLQIKAMIMVAIVVCQTLANLLVCIFQCQPIQKAWDHQIPDGHCVDIQAFYGSNAALNVLTDSVTYALSVGLIRHLRIPLKQKIGVGVILCLGFLACISSIIRITFVPALVDAADFTYVIRDAIYWSSIEINVGILAASLPSFKPLARRYFPQLIGECDSEGHQGSRELIFRSTGPNTCSSHSGFVELGEGSQSRLRTGDIALESLYGRPIGNDTNCKSVKGRNCTSVSSYEEIMTPPVGKILAHTRITIRSDG